MKNPQKGSRPTKSKVTVDPIADDVDSRLREPEQRILNEVAEFDGGEREALSKHLHDLLNSLWPAAARIELAISEKGCPPKFRETLEQLGRCVEEAMTIASQASVLVDSPTSERDPS